MATVTLTPTNVWQVDYGVVTAKNPSVTTLRQIPAQISANLSNQRAVILEYVIPENATYRHALITEVNTKAEVVSATSGGGWHRLYKNNGVDLNLQIGTMVERAGSEVLISYASGGGSWYPTTSPFLRPKNRKLYIGQIMNIQSSQTSFQEATYNTSSYGMQLVYSAGVFTVTPSKTGGYLSAVVTNVITLTATEMASQLIPYTVSSGVFYYKKTSASSYSSISFTGNAVTVPANTLERDEEYNYYFTAVADDGTTTTTEVYTVSTGDAVGTVTALSPNNMVTYGTTAFTWLYENELGNLQTAFDLQISADQSTWSDIATHQESSETAYTVSVPVGGNLYWRVRAYNQGDVASEWSNILPFSNVLPPSAPTITGVSGAGRITVAWNAESQIAYQVMIGEHDSGWVYSTNKSYFLNDYLPDGVYEIKVRVTNGIGLASDWATMTYTQSGSVAGPSVAVEMKEGFNEITISGAFDKYYILRNGVVVAQTTAGTYSDYFCNGTDNYVIRGVNADDTFGDSVLTGRYTCRRPALITRDNSILYINERLDEEPQISASNTLAVVAAEYLGRAKPVHHVGQMNTRTWSVSCSRSPVPGEIYFYRNFRGDKAWVICSNVQSTLNSIGVHEYQFTLEETDYKEAVDYEV